MLKLEAIEKGAQIKGLDPDQLATIVAATFIGEQALEVVYKTEQGALREQILYRSSESQLEVATAGRAWAFDAPATDFKLGLEATRISLAHLFDPMMAVHTSNVEPLPHQITAVYEVIYSKNWPGIPMQNPQYPKAKAEYLRGKRRYIKKAFLKGRINHEKFRHNFPWLGCSTGLQM